MSSLDSILEPILQSPRLPEAVEVLCKKFEEEQTLRQKFYQEMTPSQKVEFIEGEVVLHSPARNEHLDATGLLFRLLGAYVDAKSFRGQRRHHRLPHHRGIFDLFDYRDSQLDRHASRFK